MINLRESLACHISYDHKRLYQKMMKFLCRTGMWMYIYVISHNRFYKNDMTRQLQFCLLMTVVRNRRQPLHAILVMILYVCIRKGWSSCVEHAREYPFAWSPITILSERDDNVDGYIATLSNIYMTFQSWSCRFVSEKDDNHVSNKHLNVHLRDLLLPILLERYDKVDGHLVTLGHTRMTD